MRCEFSSLSTYEEFPPFKTFPGLSTSFQNSAMICLIESKESLQQEMFLYNDLESFNFLLYQKLVVIWYVQGCHAEI